MQRKKAVTPAEGRKHAEPIASSFHSSAQRYGLLPLQGSIAICLLDCSPPARRRRAAGEGDGSDESLLSEETLAEAAWPRAQHQDHERRLEVLKRQTWLTPEEEMEEKRLKKLKLHLKDQMERLRRAAS